MTTIIIIIAVLAIAFFVVSKSAGKKDVAKLKLPVPPAKEVVYDKAPTKLSGLRINLKGKFDYSLRDQAHYRIDATSTQNTVLVFTKDDVTVDDGITILSVDKVGDPPLKLTKGQTIKLDTVSDYSYKILDTKLAQVTLRGVYREPYVFLLDFRDPQKLTYTSQRISNVGRVITRHFGRGTFTID